MLKLPPFEVLARGQLLHPLDLKEEQAGPICQQHFDCHWHKPIPNGCPTCVARRSLCHQVLKRLAKIEAPVSHEIYHSSLEQHLMYGGSFRLILVADESIEILHRHHRVEEDEESYDEACENLESSYGLSLGQLIGVFASQGFLIFIGRDEGDKLIYGYDVSQWELSILGKGWEEAMKAFDKLVIGSEEFKLEATRENREKYRVGCI
jgi:hypothetical protein